MPFGKKTPSQLDEIVKRASETPGPGYTQQSVVEDPKIARTLKTLLHFVGAHTKPLMKWRKTIQSITKTTKRPVSAP